MKRLSGFTMIEIVAVMFILTALALVAVPVGRGALTHRQEREFMETLIEEWEMLKMKARSDHKNGDMYVKGSKRQVEFATIDGKFRVLKFPSSLTYDGSSTISCNPRGKITQAGSLNFKYAEKRFWRVSFQLGWGRGVFVKN
ncbi:type II secretion system protein [Lacticaseibacillus casei]|uniref:Competence protein ComGC n=3 Tax=Lacticaseibacillus TaxID=2759736 RepID=A0AAN1C7W8_LACCA|nr:competence protein ComGC [Lacticaseibacillus casei]KAB1969149.1 type II secretion system protein [Lacticaseibacillus casei]